MDLRYVLIECPYDSWSDSEVQRLFGRLIELKIEGFLAVYPYGTLPFDTTDFVAAQHLICREINGALEPLMCWKTISAERCGLHSLPFPPLALLESIAATDHLRALASIVGRNAGRPRALAYIGGLTYTPGLRSDRKLLKLLWDLYNVAGVAYDLENGVRDILAFAALRFNVLRRMEITGYRALPDETTGLELPPLRFPSQMKGYPARLIHRQEISKQGLELFERYRHWWNARLVFPAMPQSATAGAKAA